MKFALVLGLLLALAAVSMAAVSSAPNQTTESQSYRATAEMGPVLRAHMPASADVFVNGKLAFRIPESAGRMTPIERARIVAERLNNAFAAGYSWQEMRVAETKGLHTVDIHTHMIVTADSRSARAMHISTGQLANRWARNTVVALGGKPQSIAMNLQPVRTKVAGSQQEIGVMAWSTKSSKSIPLLLAENGTAMGDVTVAGSQNALRNANSVVMYQSASGSAVVWTFVPIAGTSTGGTLYRAPGVGITAVPSSLIPTGYETGSNVTQLTDSMADEWNKTINASLGENGLPTHATTKIVPLYSMESSQIVGAAQIVGNASNIDAARTVVMSMSGDQHQFGATSDDAQSIAGAPSMMDGVVLSSIIMVSMPAVTQPAPAVQPSVTTPAEPSTAPPAEPTTVAPEQQPPANTGPSTGETQPKQYPKPPIEPIEGAPGSGY
jgi:hypothetical protein